MGAVLGAGVAELSKSPQSIAGTAPGAMCPSQRLPGVLGGRAGEQGTGMCSLLKGSARKQGALMLDGSSGCFPLRNCSGGRKLCFVKGRD